MKEERKTNGSLAEMKIVAFSLSATYLIRRSSVLVWIQRITIYYRSRWVYQVRPRVSNCFMVVGSSGPDPIKDRSFQTENYSSPYFAVVLMLLQFHLST
ncbi:hypothetical protein OUZ56_007570 [Daphnia magna]|uniref:Uncharacterized protein n=1 Tax=Daphnia magna TaxID=35525 RepID=A0ABR0AAB1_9CRUS|nr:hypothetical protein OUZ56_007570 [Daphnia magna]